MRRWTTLLLALSALALAMGTPACRPGPAPGTSGEADAGVSSLASVMDDALSATLVSVRRRPVDERSPAHGAERAALDVRWRAAAGTRVAVPHCHGTAQDVLQEGARCAYTCSSDRECRGGDRCALAFELPSSGEVEADPTTLTVCTPAGDGTLDIALDAGTGARATRPSLFGAAHLAGGGCARGFASVPSVGALCYRSCNSDLDCPEDASCQREGRGSAKLCVVR